MSPDLLSASSLPFMLLNLGYLFALVMFLLLGLASRGRDGLPGVPGVAVPALATALWAGFFLLDEGTYSGGFLSALATMGRDGTWVWYLWRNLQDIASRQGGCADVYSFKTTKYKINLTNLNNIIGIPFTTFLGMSSVIIVVMFGAYGHGGLPVFFLTVLPLLFSLTGMTLMLRLYARHPHGNAFLLSGVGGLFGFDLYLHTQTLFFSGSTLLSWSMRPWLDALCAVAIGVALTRKIRIDLRLGMSLSMLSQVLAIGIVVILGGALSLTVLPSHSRALPGGLAQGETDWMAVGRVLLLSGSAATLFWVMLSGRLRARIRVFLAKNFFRYHYDYRLEWLRFTTLLSEGEAGQGQNERVLQALARLVESTSAILWVRQQDAYLPVAQWKTPLIDRPIAAEARIARKMESDNWIVDLDECRENPQARRDNGVPDWLLADRDAWLVVPLPWQGAMIGLVLLGHSPEKNQFNWEISDLLKTAARQAAAHIAQAKAAEALMVARQFESFHRTSTFVVHDIKNLVAQLSLMLANAEKHKHNPAFQEDMLVTVESTVARMNRMLHKLSEPHHPAPPKALELGEMLALVINSKSAYAIKPSLEISEKPLWVLAEQERLVRVCGHLVQNAIEATAGTGHVDVRVSRDARQGVIEIMDDGIGMDERFIKEKLFQPFVSTKSTGMGVGAYECRAYVQELGGSMNVSSQPGQGTRIVIRLPLQTQDNQHA